VDTKARNCVLLVKRTEVPCRAAQSVKSRSYAALLWQLTTVKPEKKDADWPNRITGITVGINVLLLQASMLVFCRTSSVLDQIRLTVAARQGTLCRPQCWSFTEPARFWTKFDQLSLRDRALFTGLNVGLLPNQLGSGPNSANCRCATCLLHGVDMFSFSAFRV